MTVGRTHFLGITALLAVVGIFALVVGGHDVFVARGFSSRLFGAFLAVAGLIMLIAAAGVVRRATWHVALSLVGSFAAFLVGMALLLAQLEAGGRPTLLLAWLAVVIASLTALALSLGPGGQQVSGAVRRVQLVAVVGMLLGVGQFAFTTLFGPALAGPHLNVTSSLQRLGAKEVGKNEGLVAVKARITFENASDRKLFLVDSVYRVVGQRITAREDTGDAFVGELSRSSSTAGPTLSGVAAVRHSAERGGTVLHAGQVLERGFWFEPGESFRKEFVLYAPARRYDLIRLLAQVQIADSSLLELSEFPSDGPRPRQQHTPTCVYVSAVDTRWDVRETSWVRRLIRKDSVLWSRWLVEIRRDEPVNTAGSKCRRARPAARPRADLPYVLAYVDERDSDFDPFTQPVFPSRIQSLSNMYGVIATYSRTELALFP